MADSPPSQSKMATGHALNQGMGVQRSHQKRPWPKGPSEVMLTKGPGNQG